MRFSTHQQLALWLFSLAAMIAATVLVGGLTRLTDSGLSITEWAPIRGIVPPRSLADWQAAFALYQQIPEYQLVNRTMNLAEFKIIYWWEWAHRLLGRLVGLVFAVPFFIFWARGKIPRARLPELLSLFVLGGLQGLLGWYMVQSGLVERVDVSQYRLAAHLGLALLLFSWSLWLALDFWHATPPRHAWHYGALALVALVLMQSLLGALVAGLDAGVTYTDWPFMDGALLPDGLLAQSPLWRNLFENILTVQFNHRLGGYLLLLVVFWHCWRLSGAAARRANILALALLAQAGLGIAVLMLAVPIALGALHQLGGLVVLSLAVRHLFLCRAGL